MITRLVRALLLVGFVAGTSLSAAASLTCSVHVAGASAAAESEAGHGHRTDHDANHGADHGEHGHDEHGDDKHGEHDCSCLGACCPGTSVSPLQADAVASFIPLLALSPSTVHAETPRHRVARLLPFANAPPREL